jgi:MFS transporter, CP family, cyanate transporter
VVAGVLLAAANLRASLTGVGPLLPSLSTGIGLSAATSGLLTTAPLVAFAAVSPLVPRAVSRLGLERTLFAALLALTGGIAVRSAGTAPALFGGTIVAGAAIAVCNVLLPALVKRDFPTSVSAVTACYVTVMGLAGGLAAGIAVPVGESRGWRIALGCWLLPALLASAAWAPRALAHTPAQPEQHPIVHRTARLPWKEPLAWAVTAFMGLQSLGFYVLINWMPSVLRGHLNPTSAGWNLFILQAVAVLTSLATPLLNRRRADQRALAVGCSLISLAGYLVLLYAPGFATGCAVLTGIGTGASITLALAFLGLRAPDPTTAAALSAMAQAIGYLIAATGPFLFGVLHAATTGWTIPVLLLCLTAFAQAIVGYRAGRGTLPSVTRAPSASTRGTGGDIDRSRGPLARIAGSTSPDQVAGVAGATHENVVDLQVKQSRHGRPRGWLR